MTVTKATYCRNVRRSKIPVNVSKAVFPRKIIIKKIIKGHFIENVRYLFQKLFCSRKQKGHLSTHQQECP